MKRLPHKKVAFTPFLLLENFTYNRSRQSSHFHTPPPSRSKPPIAFSWSLLWSRDSYFYHYPALNQYHWLKRQPQNQHSDNSFPKLWVVGLIITSGSALKYSVNNIPCHQVLYSQIELQRVTHIPSHIWVPSPTLYDKFPLLLSFRIHCRFSCQGGMIHQWTDIWNSGNLFMAVTYPILPKTLLHLPVMALYLLLSYFTEITPLLGVKQIGLAPNFSSTYLHIFKYLR